MHDRFENFFDADAHLRAGIDRFLCRNGEDVFQLLVDRRNVGIRQIDLVDDRNDRQVLFVREMNVRHRLRFDALRRIDDQQRAFARRQRCAKLRRQNRHVPACRAGSADTSCPIFRACNFIATGCALIVMPRSRSRSIESSN